MHVLVLCLNYILYNTRSSTFLKSQFYLHAQEDCNQLLGWYQSAKERQGSVEKTSYGQMRNILKYGCYRVGANYSESSKGAAQSVNQLISMRLEERDQKFLQKVYTLDELRDLESKLVLICGNKEKSRTEVDHFLNVSSKLLGAKGSPFVQVPLFVSTFFFYWSQHFHALYAYTFHYP